MLFHFVIQKIFVAKNRNHHHFIDEHMKSVFTVNMLNFSVRNEVNLLIFNKTLYVLSNKKISTLWFFTFSNIIDKLVFHMENFL